MRRSSTGAVSVTYRIRFLATAQAAQGCYGPGLVGCRGGLLGVTTAPCSPSGWWKPDVSNRIRQTAADPSGSRRSHGADAQSGLVPATVAHDVDHDVADLVTLVDVPVRLDDLGHRIDAVDHDLKAVLAE